MKFLQITLQKRLEHIQSSNIASTNTMPPNTLIAFGHYDRIEVLPKKEWHDFRPVTRKNRGGVFFDDYTIRLVHPKQKADEGDYVFWEKLSDLDGGKYSDETQGTPFLACCLINLSDGFISDLYEQCAGQGTKYSHYMELVLRNLNKVLHAKKANLYTAIYFTLGYTDLVVLFRANSYSVIQEGIDALRASEYAGSDSQPQKTIISSSYTIFGLFGQNDKAVSGWKVPEEETITAFCDISLALGCSEQDFFTAWMDYKKEYPEFEGKANIYSITGNFDWRLSFENLSLSSFCKLFESDGFLSEFAMGSVSHIKNISTKLLFPVSDEEAHGKAETENPLQYLIDNRDITKLIDEQLGTFEEGYKSLVKEQHVHRRTMLAMRNIHKTFRKLIDSSHGYEVRIIAGRFFNEFLKMLNDYIRNKKEWSLTDLQALENCIGDFRGKMSFLLFDLWRSDQPFFEGQTIAHPSIGSTAKLLFAYNKVFQNWSRLWDEEYPQDPPKGFSFLITSGGCDETITRNPFARFADYMKPQSDVGIVQIPEASLYDVKGTLLRLAHEFFHLRGERMRSKRASWYLQGLCFALIDELKNKAIYPSIASVYTATRKDLLPTEKQDIVERICFDILKLRQDDEKILNTERRFEDAVYNILWTECNWEGKFKTEADLESENNKKFYYGETIYATCRKYLVEFLETKKEADPIKKIAEALSEFQIEVAANPKFEELLYGKKSSGPFSELIWIFDETQKPWLIQKNFGLIENMIKRLRGRLIHIGTIFEFLYKECFADCIAVKALGYGPFDYIFQFLYENRGVDTFFEIKREEGAEEVCVSAFVSWRLSIVCAVCFGEESSLMVKDEETFKKAFDEAFEAFVPILHLELDYAFENKGLQDNFENKESIKAVESYIEAYKKSLYQVLCFIRKDYAETRELRHVHCLKQYLAACLKENKSIIETLRKETEIVSKSSYSQVGDDVVSYLMDNWIRIYAKEGNCHVEPN